MHFFNPGNLVKVEFENSGDLSGISESTAPSKQHTSASTFWIQVLSPQSHVGAYQKFLDITVPTE